jgi:gluconokinase
MISVVMGIAVSGTSTLAHALAGTLGWTFVEGDERQSPANIGKMTRGEPLDDADRASWLEGLHRELARLDAREAGAVLACSALKARYRVQLAAGLGVVRFVHLVGDPVVVERRLRERQWHFTQACLFASQVEALEPPADALPVPIDLPTDRQLDRVLKSTRGDTRR